MKVRLCVRMRGRSGQGRSAAWSGRDAVRGRREGFHGQGESRPDWAATETLSAAWLPPKDSASFPPPAHLAPVSPLSSATTLSFTFLSPPFVSSILHPPVPPARSLFLAPFLHFSQFLSFFFFSFFFFFPPLLVWAITDTQQQAERRGWVAAVVGWGDWGGTKALRCSGPTRVAGFEKKLDGFLMQRVDGQTRIDGQSRLSSLSSSFSWCLFWPKKHIIRLVPFPLCLMFYQTH